MYRFFLFVLAVALIGFYAIGCGGPKADKELADAEAALQAAREAGAEGTPEYQEAEELIQRAKQLMAEGKQNEARSLLEEARFKAIQAKGAGISESRLAEMSEEELEARERELQGLTPGGDIGLGDVFFDFDQSAIRVDAKPVLDDNARIINSRAGNLQVVVIEGYCDIRGTEEYNLALGQRRAESTKSYLVGIGVPPSLVEAVSKGETTQWAAGTTESAFQQNRRAHFVPAVSSSPSF